MFATLALQAYLSQTIIKKYCDQQILTFISFIICSSAGVHYHINCQIRERVLTRAVKKSGMITHLWHALNYTRSRSPGDEWNESVHQSVRVQILNDFSLQHEYFHPQPSSHSDRHHPLVIQLIIVSKRTQNCCKRHAVREEIRFFLGSCVKVFQQNRAKVDLSFITKRLENYQQTMLQLCRGSVKNLFGEY